MSDLKWPSSIRFVIPSTFAEVLPEIWEVELLPLLSLVDIYALSLVDKKSRIFIGMLITRKPRMRGAGVETLTALLVNRFRLPPPSVFAIDPWCFDVFNQLRFERLADLPPHLINRACHRLPLRGIRPLSLSLRNTSNVNDAVWMLDTLAAHWLPIDVTLSAAVLAGRVDVFAHRPRWIQYIRRLPAFRIFAILSNEMPMLDFINSALGGESPGSRIGDIAAALATSNAMVARVFQCPRPPRVVRDLARTCHQFPGSLDRLTLLYPDKASRAIIADEYSRFIPPYLL